MPTSSATATVARKVCKDCLPGSKRPAPYPGPRCSTHHLAYRNRVSEAQHGRHVEQTYGITPEEYRKLYEAQGGRCAICLKGSGKFKRLAVDHDHNCRQGHERTVACRKCVRGLICPTRCNQILLGRYDRDTLQRAVEYLDRPPAQSLLRNWER